MDLVDHDNYSALKMALTLLENTLGEVGIQGLATGSIRLVAVDRSDARLIDISDVEGSQDTWDRIEDVVLAFGFALDGRQVVIPKERYQHPAYAGVPETVTRQSAPRMEGWGPPDPEPPQWALEAAANISHQAVSLVDAGTMLYDLHGFVRLRLLYEIAAALVAERDKAAMSPNVRAAMGEWEIPTVPEWALLAASEVTAQIVPQSGSQDPSNVLYALPTGLSYRLTCDIAQALVVERAKFELSAREASDV